MSKSFSKLKVNPGKYADIANREAVHIAKNGRRVAKLTEVTTDKMDRDQIKIKDWFSVKFDHFCFIRLAEISLAIVRIFAIVILLFMAFALIRSVYFWGFNRYFIFENIELFGVILGVISTFIGLRMCYEVGVVFFKMNDTLNEIKELLKHSPEIAEAEVVKDLTTVAE